MKKRKLLLFGVVVSILSIGSFSNAQFVDSTEYICNGNCSVIIPFDSSNTYIVKSLSNGSNIRFRYRYYCANGFSGTSHGSVNGGVYNFGNLCNHQHSVVDKIELLRCWGGFTTESDEVCSVSYSKEILPISEFTPVINGLKNSLTEFIPYVVYVGIGIISALLGFFAIRYLINWVRNNTLSVFKSRKRR